MKDGNSTTAYRYSPLGPARLLFGPMFLLFGAGFLAVFWSELQHAQRNGGLSTGPLDFVLWGGFLVVPLIFLLCGIAIVQSDRRSWIEDSAWHTARGEFPMFHRRHDKDEVRAFVVDEGPAIAVFAGRSSVVGHRYYAQALLANGKRVNIAWFLDRASAQAVVDRFDREVGSSLVSPAITQ